MHAISDYQVQAQVQMVYCDLGFQPITHVHGMEYHLAHN